MRSLFFQLATILLGAFAFFSAPSLCFAAPLTDRYNRPAQETEITEEHLAATEQKLLQKTYTNDPLPKRLQRLELSLFGATQYGSDEQRWRNIKHALNAATPKSNISSSLNELEKYVFNKTAPAGKTTSQATALQRLNRLETKLFGKPSPSMPTAYRVERLKRTLGLAATPDGMAQLPPSIRGMPGMEMAPGTPMFGFGNNFGFDGNGTGDPDFNQFESQMSQLFREMEQMQQMQPYGSDQTPGNEEHRFYMYSTPDGGFKFGTDPGNNLNPKNTKPNGGKNKKLKPIPSLPAPQLTPQPNVPEDHIPSYADPNFI
jgi:hypothetical protein